MREKILIAVFLIVIFGLGIGSLVMPDRDFSEEENRYLQQLPAVEPKKVLEGVFATDYETYVTDQFLFRDQWISLKTTAERLSLKRDSKGVYFGKDGYLIQKYGAKTFESALAEKNIKVLQNFVERNRDYVEQGRMSVLLVPTASEILTDELPDLAAPYDQTLFLNSRKEALGSAYVDVLGELKEHQNEYLYYRTDHHWTTLGAYYGYLAWAKQQNVTPWEQEDFQIEPVTKEFYGTLHSKLGGAGEADTINLYYPKSAVAYHLDYEMGEFQRDSLYDMEKLEGKDKYAVFLGGNYGLVTIEGGCDNGRTLVMIKDSFAHSMVPFLANHYETIYMVDLRYFNVGITNFIESVEATDIMLLFNTANLVEDRNLQKLAK